jgi:enolase
VSVIAAVSGRQVLDSRGRPTVEVEVRLHDGTLGRASVPSGASTGTFEAHELRDGDPAVFAGLGVATAVGHVRGEIAGALRGRDADDQTGVDTLLRELDGTPQLARLGANAVLGASLAVCRAATLSSGRPLYRRIAELAGVGTPILPMPMVNIFSGGLHAGRRMDVQDFLVIPSGAGSLLEAVHLAARVRSAATGLCAERGLPTLLADEGGLSPGCRTGRDALELLVEAIERAGLEPGRDAVIAIDVAAHSLLDPAGGYRLSREDVHRSSGEMLEMVAGWVADFPVVSVEDPLDEDDWAGWADLTALVGDRVRLIGDDLFTTNPERLARGIAAGCANGVLIKANQNGTLTGTREVVRIARDAGYVPVVSARSGETEDDFLADLAVGAAAGQVKIGSLRTSDRLAKYNQLLRIAEDDSLPFAGMAGAGPTLVDSATGSPAVTGTSPATAAPPRAMVEFLRASGLAPEGTTARWTPLTGGVSSDLWRVDLPQGSICVKAALATLRVADTWEAPVGRNAVEADWLRFAAAHAPRAVPEVLAADPAAGVFAMEFLDPADHPVWKSELMAGRVDVAVARAVGDLVGRLHRASTHADRRQELARRFATDDNFHRLRIAPYLLTTAGRHPEVAERLRSLAARTAATHLALVHGDVSPKNILLGPAGPVLLDAECAWWGDPAFDVAFCLNHLLLKVLVAAPADRASRAERLAAAADGWWSGYVGHLSWEPADRLQARVAQLLPALLLARVDGTSPVEYITRDVDRELVRTVAVALLTAAGSRSLTRAEDVFTTWRNALGARPGLDP